MRRHGGRQATGVHDSTSFTPRQSTARPFSRPCGGRSARTADPDIAAFASAVRPIHLLAHAVLPLVLSAIYCAREGNFLVGIKLGLLVFGVTYLASVGMARRGGGQTRYSIYAAAQIAQLAALAIHRAFWAEIHG